ncbi:hypothetical protein OC834_006276 [Tilletia horrida]|uniref:Fatty acid desaturase domain-containing protein n=1 Tax=Tilletia horrida TaxID=155126 RepID=A0AAN6GD27_9BASI|nr:hypothetical protein OC834_006276 [Tilletia horrida]KAK0522995.1 hypothetical protein OC835_006397 [Tilletia horrida]KAK0534106.1 hypothetical protein OC842_002747 [Tilletia horrida]KAK0552138.1 hypothetical protein OC844_006482 [Tilletia horrida]
MASTAVAPAASVAAPRVNGKAKPVSAKLSKPDPNVRYSSRNPRPYNADEIRQFKVPNLTIKDLLSAIPQHCFERSLLKSSLSLGKDFVLLAVFAYAATFIDPFLRSVDFASSPLTPYLAPATQFSLARFAAWAFWSFWQGLVFTGVWVVAHECGHQAFSSSKFINNTVGWFLHSALLVPYHSWRISHARHHAATGHLTRDEVFVPRTRAQRGLKPLKPLVSEDEDPKAAEQAEKLAGKVIRQDNETWGEWFHELLEDAPLYNLIYIVVQQTMGWPLYLLKNSSGQLHYPKGTNHFNPDAIIFDARHRNQVIVSDIGIGLVLSGLAAWGLLSPGGFGEVFRYYIVPYLWCNNWLVMITYLQHTDPLLPHYKAEAWTFPRGALCTIDRVWLGPIGAFFLHGIAETHVAHHISSKIPHYNAWEATEALKQRLGEHYVCSTENILVSLWKSIRTCRFVDENDEVAFYRTIDGVPHAVVAPDSSNNSDSGVGM